jgi:hypothetical protein
MIMAVQWLNYCQQDEKQTKNQSINKLLCYIKIKITIYKAELLRRGTIYMRQIVIGNTIFQ